MLKIKNIFILEKDQPLEKIKLLNESIENSLLLYYNADEIDTLFVTINEFIDINLKDCDILQINLIRTPNNNFKLFYNKQNVIKLNRFLLKNKSNILVLSELLENINHIPAIKTFFPPELYNQINFVTSNVSITNQDIKVIYSLLLLPYCKLFLNEDIPVSTIKKDFFIPANTVRSSKYIVLHLLKHEKLLENNYYSYINKSSELTKDNILQMYKNSTEIKLLEEVLENNIEKNTIGSLYIENLYDKNRYFNLNYDKDFLQLFNQAMIITIIEDKAYNDIKKDNFNQLSEKFFLPIIMKKPFIVFYCKNFLKDIKKFGFKSFDPFINEQYDSIEDDILRYKLAVQEMKRISNLSKSEKQKFYNNILPICEHNFNIMSEYIRNKNFLK